MMGSVSERVNKLSLPQIKAAAITPGHQPHHIKITLIYSPKHMRCLKNPACRSMYVVQSLWAHTPWAIKLHAKRGKTFFNTTLTVLHRTLQCLQYVRSKVCTDAMTNISNQAIAGKLLPQTFQAGSFLLSPQIAAKFKQTVQVVPCQGAQTCQKKVLWKRQHSEPVCLSMFSS